MFEFDILAFLYFDKFKVSPNFNEIPFSTTISSLLYPSVTNKNCCSKFDILSANVTFPYNGETDMANIINVVFIIIFNFLLFKRTPLIPIVIFC